MKNSLAASNHSVKSIDPTLCFRYIDQKQPPFPVVNSEILTPFICGQSVNSQKAL